MRMLEVLILNALMMVISLVCLAAAVWSLLSGQASRDGFDATFLFLASLLLTATFSISPMSAWREGLLRDALAVYISLLKGHLRKFRAGRSGRRRNTSIDRRPYAAA
jgi:hypothetical protein